ncbi:hypothetical protein E2C01_049136 [Portunus trituberculatus]|uniref:Uncharacterized protein n=1 Tax=Portunus trituberculatus TaxID=210409 RepID=A0A5B7GCV7_PORTR|nr:hypothetical protein [Portunus trituberculatus]
METKLKVKHGYRRVLQWIEAKNSGCELSGTNEKNVAAALLQMPKYYPSVGVSVVQMWKIPLEISLEY